MTFSSMLEVINGTMTIESVVLCTVISLFYGVIISYIYRLDGKYTKNFAMTLVILPALVQMVIMAVNGNLGTGVAVLGTFSLVRFRSVPGSSKEICCIFFAMAVGLSMGMGQILFGGILVGVIGAAFVVMERTAFGEGNKSCRSLKVTIPESLEYTNVFDDIFQQYAKKSSLERVKTTNMGAMIELDYTITLRDMAKEKEFLDAIRCRNGNLTIIFSRLQTMNTEL